jgi:hypothetical protein
LSSGSGRQQIALPWSRRPNHSVAGFCSNSRRLSDGTQSCYRARPTRESASCTSARPDAGNFSGHPPHSKKSMRMDLHAQS